MKNVRCVSFNSYTTGWLFSHVLNVYRNHAIKSCNQVYNLDETGVRPERDGINVKKRRVITEVRNKMTFSLFNFFSDTAFWCFFSWEQMVCSLHQRQFLEASVNLACQTAICISLLVLFYQRGELHTGVVKLPASTRPFLPSGLTYLLSASEKTFLLTKILYCSILRSCYIAHKSAVIKNLAEINIVVVALSAHTSNRLQPLDVSVFSPSKNCVERSPFAKLVRVSQQLQGKYNLKRQEVWDGIVEG